MIKSLPHLGAAAFQMEWRGIKTERGNLNRQIEFTNQRLRQLKARIVKLQTWVKGETENTAPPTLADVIQNILSKREQSGKSNRYQTIYNLKTAANLLVFLQNNSIKDMAGLEGKIMGMYEKQFEIRDNLKPIERRLQTLDEHIRQAAYYLEFKKIYGIYKQ